MIGCNGFMNYSTGIILVNYIVSFKTFDNDDIVLLKAFETLLDERYVFNIIISWPRAP